jgi:hypothetical protein
MPMTVAPEARSRDVLAGIAPIVLSGSEAFSRAALVSGQAHWKAIELARGPTERGGSRGLRGPAARGVRCARAALCSWWLGR